MIAVASHPCACHLPGIGPCPERVEELGQLCHDCSHMCRGYLESLVDESADDL